MKKTHSAGGVILNRDGDVLVTNQNSNSWSLPKGHLEKGESAMEAAVREIQEETGITQLEYVRDLGTYKRHKIALNGGDDVSEEKQLTFFLFTTDQMELAPEDDKHPEARWVNKNEVADLLTHPKDKEFFTSVVATL